MDILGSADRVLTAVYCEAKGDSGDLPSSLEDRMEAVIAFLDTKKGKKRRREK